jgi:hypothetical protein
MTEEELEQLAELVADKLAKRMYPQPSYIPAQPTYVPAHQPFLPPGYQPNPLFPNPMYPQPTYLNPFSPTTVTCESTAKD